MSLRMASRSSVVWACTPSAAEMTSTAPSSTARDRSTSPMKSVCPGVSTMFILSSPRGRDAEAVFTEMPRLRSTSRLSVVAVPLSTVPGALMAPEAARSCSVSVVLPASTWASMPMFLNLVI